MTPAYIGLGSNLENPARQLQSAVTALDALPDSEVACISSVYRSTAVGPGNQPDYLNAVLLLSTGLRPLELLNALQAIEGRQGRVRGVRWGPRTLDLDILLYGREHMAGERLTVPHPEMARRGFVLHPLAEIAGDNLLLPDGTVLGTLIAACPGEGVARTPLRLEKNDIQDK